MAVVLVAAACGAPAPRADAPTPTGAATATTGEPGATAAPDPAGTVAPLTDAGSPDTVGDTVAPDTTNPNGVSGEASAPDDPQVPTTVAYPPCTETSGTVQHFTFNSSVMRFVHPVEGYNVYTPPCYQRDANRKYPVIYLLHGANKDENEWINNGTVNTANRLIAAGAIPPVVLVLADGMDAMGDYDAAPGKLQPFDFYLLYELKPRVQQAFRTLNNHFYRAIGGISRGGEWALLSAERHPDVFGAVGGHSPAVGTPTNPATTLAPLMAGKGLRIWLDVGTSDSLFSNVSALDAALSARGVAHDFHTGPGAHADPYWGNNAEAYLRWYTAPWNPNPNVNASGAGGAGAAASNGVRG
jgi:enterochelin esterase-like enzyme